jgi:uncharacterized protein YyaL (SSP411 family)
MKTALDYYLGPVKQVIVAGDRNDVLTQRLVAEVYSRFLPRKVLFLADDGRADQAFSESLEYLAQLKRIKGKATAYVCEDYLCRMPTSDPEVLGSLLE